ncbi:hypothetical protein Tco_0691357 [Tanacetum coccineum]
MCTYLKNMEGYKIKDLKLNEFDSIKDMFDRAFKRVNTFEDFRTDLVKGKEKRAGTKLVQEITKKQKVEDDKETAELKQLIKIIPDEEEVAIDVIPLAVKEDLEDLYKLVKDKYKSTRPVEDLDLLLWGDLKTMFEPHVEDKVWRNQQEYKVLNWKLYDSCGERIKKTKRSKNDQKPTRNGKKTKTRANSEESAKDHSRISPTQQERQSKKETMKSRAKIKSKGPRMTSVNVVGGKNKHMELPFIQICLLWKTISIFDISRDEEEDGTVADMNNLDYNNPTLYGLHQAPRAWYETLSTYLLDNGFQRGKIDKTLFIKEQRFTKVKTTSTSMETQKPLLKDEDGEEVDVYMYRYHVNPKVSHLHAVKRFLAYTDSDYAGASLDRKSTTGDDEISNLVDLHMGMFDGGWKWQDLQGLLWLDHHKTVCAVTHVYSSESTGLCVEENAFTTTPRKLVSSSETERLLDIDMLIFDR